MTNDQLRTIRPKQLKPVKLDNLIRQFKLHTTGAYQNSKHQHATITGITLDSRDVRTGDLYVGMPGATRHGAQFANEARSLGAQAILTDPTGAQLAAQSGLPILVCQEHPRNIMGQIAATIYDTQNLQAKVFGITGTNGKTSVVYMLTALLKAAGHTPGLSSTAERRAGEEVIPSKLTSPESSELHGLLARMIEQDVDAIAIEISAQAIVRHRLDGLQFDVVAFNNFSQDHLEEFTNLENYFLAKQQLFTPSKAHKAVVVTDSVWGQRIARESHIPVTTLTTQYGQNADWHLAVTRQNLDGVSFALQGPDGAHFQGSVPLFGRFMAENAALALIMLHEAGISLTQVSNGLHHGRIPVYIPGRLEEITAGGDGPRVYVDYGHTPGSFQACLDALGEVCEGRIIFMFGADGDRDTSKREDMGRIAANGSDILIICDYHPRSEPPELIRAQLISGARQAHRATIYEEADPRQAIRLALSLAQPGDTILYAGPGHEEHQEVAGEFIPYSARDEVRDALREIGSLP